MQENKELAQSIMEDFQDRQRQRRSFELKWLLNMNFLAGNQYSSISPSGEIEPLAKEYEWECREVFNHIAPIIETRLSKLSRFRPQMSVRSSGSGDDDIAAAKLSTKILSGVSSNIELQSIINNANKWSEICGTSFYKIIWDKSLGMRIAKGDDDMFEGDVKVVAVSPFEIYPECAAIEDIDMQSSVMHAKAHTVSEIENMWNIKIQGRDINVNTLENLASPSYLGSSIYSKYTDKQVMKNSELVIEKYTAPNFNHPNGRLTIVCGDYVLHDGDLPFCNKGGNKKGYPFVKQVSLPQVGSFWGISIIERLIPIQRAYNSVKCRKYEFMSRVSMGVLRVEDGSIDTDNLADEGLSPGKILIYRQGANPPQVMENMSVPLDFLREEDRLLNEFILISGVSEFLRSGSLKVENMSGVALQIVTEQDDTKIAITVDSLKLAVREIAKQVLMLYKQFASSSRLLKVAGNGGEIEVFEFDSNSISSYDVIYDAESELSQTLSQRRSMAFDLLKSGLLTDENGRISNRMRAKILDILGFGAWEYSQDISQTHIAKAQLENKNFCKDCEVIDIDDHDIHISEHTKFYLTMQMKDKQHDLDKVGKHIKEHEKIQNLRTFERQMKTSDDM